MTKANVRQGEHHLRDLGPPLPPSFDTVPILRGMKAELNAELPNSRRYLARLLGAVVRALIVYLLGVPIFWFAIMDLFLFVDRGESLLGSGGVRERIDYRLISCCDDRAPGAKAGGESVAGFCPIWWL